MKTVLLNLISFFLVDKCFFLKALTKTLKNSIYQTKRFDKFSFPTSARFISDQCSNYSLVRVKSLSLSLSLIPVVS